MKIVCSFANNRKTTIDSYFPRSKLLVLHTFYSEEHFTFLLSSVSWNIRSQSDPKPAFFCWNQSSQQEMLTGENVFDLHLITWMQELKQTPSDQIHLEEKHLRFPKCAGIVIPSACNSFSFSIITWLIPVCVVMPLVVKMTLPFKDNKTTNPPRAESSNSISGDLADTPTITMAFRKRVFF